MASTLGQFNPLRYRGYVWDNETGLYYLQSRYYNPSWGRWINADDRLLTNHQLGFNVFAYCGNNPVNLSDPTGHCPCEWVSRCTCPENPHYRKKLIQVDKKNFDWNNTDEQKVLDATYFSAYKGRLVIKNPWFDFSLGVIFIGETEDRHAAVQHEYGHTVQLSLLGAQKYIINIAIPSMISSTQKPHYLMPWEVGADTLGGSKENNHSTGSKVIGIIYLILCGLLQ